MCNVLQLQTLSTTTMAEGADILLLSSVSAMPNCGTQVAVEDFKFEME